jgi:hypothetical protein
MEVRHFRFLFAEYKWKLSFSVSSVSVYGVPDTWRNGHRHGDMETWRHGDMETWRHEDLETWRLGYGDIIRKTENGSPGDFP